MSNSPTFPYAVTSCPVEETSLASHDGRRDPEEPSHTSCGTVWLKFPQLSVKPIRTMALETSFALTKSHDDTYHNLVVWLLVARFATRYQSARGPVMQRRCRWIGCY